MTTLDKIIVAWQEDGSAMALARVTAPDATGDATGVRGEGYWVKQADLAAGGITCNVFDLSVPAETLIANPTVSISSAILDTPETDPALWDVDDVGYNFKFRLPASCFPVGGRKYLVEFYFQTTGGTDKWTIQYEGLASPVKGS